MGNSQIKGPENNLLLFRERLFCSKILFPRRRKTGKIGAFMMKIGVFVEIIFP